MQPLCLLLLCSLILSCSYNKDSSNENNTLLLVSKAAVSSESLKSGKAYETYYNYNFDFYLDYPAAILLMDPPTENGDGRSFRDRAGNQILLAYGTLDADWETAKSLTLEEQYLRDVDSYSAESRISYKVCKPDYYIISGTMGDSIFYQKTIKKPSVFVHAILKYAQKDTAIYDLVAQRIFETLK